MSFPIIMLCGQKNSGKSTVADMLVKNHNCLSISLADPIKQFIHQVFEVPNEYLWGTSELRDKLVKIDKLRALSKIKRMEFGVNAAVHDLVRRGHSDLIRYIEDMPEEISPRKVAQWFGTDFGRKYNDYVWISEGIRCIFGILMEKNNFTYDKTKGLVLTDEKHRYNGFVIEDGRFVNEIEYVLRQNGLLWRIVDPDAENTDTHASETGLDRVSDYFFNVTIYNNKSKGVEHLAQTVEAAWFTTFSNSKVFRL